jgi:OOP family OmpA-OmpF porin
VRRLEGSVIALLLALAGVPASAEEAAPAPPPETEAATAPPVGSPPPPVRRVVLRGIKFGSDTAYIEPASAGVLELVAERLRENPDVRVRIEGHTDERASEAYNLELSRERAEAVKRILVGFGVVPDRLDAVGYGESRPIASNDTAEGRALNRRVELEVIE